MNRQNLSVVLFTLLLLSATPLLANNLIMVRTALPLEQVATQLEAVAVDHGYVVVDDVLTDLSLVDVGAGEPEYKIISVENRVSSDGLLARYPMLAPFIPWRIALFVENGTTLLVTLNPLYLEHHFPNSGPTDFFRQSSRELRKILLNAGAIKL